MIHIFGDSHADFCFRNLNHEHKNHFIRSITMHRIGRDQFGGIDFAKYDIQDGDMVIYQVGEVDCRCHIYRQLQTGRPLDIITSELIDNFIASIKLNNSRYKSLKIIICCIPPPICKDYYESIHGPVTHEFPFLGSDEMRSYYTIRMNKLLKDACIENNMTFLDYYEKYTNEHNLLRVELSDNICHIRENQMILTVLDEIILK